MSERYSTLLTGEPGCREWAARESALAAQDPPLVIVHPIPTHVVRCMHVRIYLWRWDWHHWWLWGCRGSHKRDPVKCHTPHWDRRDTWSKTLSTSSCGQPRLGGTRQCKGLSCKGRPFTECAGCGHLAENSLIFMQHKRS